MILDRIALILAIVGGAAALWFLYRRSQALPMTLITDSDTTLDLPTENCEENAEGTETTEDDENTEEETDNGKKQGQVRFKERTLCTCHRDSRHHWS